MTKMKTEINNIKSSEVIENLFAIAKVEAIYCNSVLIRNDMKYAVKEFDEFDSYDIEGKFYVAIRQNGVEHGINLSYVENRCRILGDAHVVIKIERKENGMCDMKINRK